MKYKTHCVRGHLRSAENVGRRYTCQDCEREQHKSARLTRALTKQPKKTRAEAREPRRVANLCPSCATGACVHRGPCLSVVAPPPADHICRCGDATRPKSSPEFNPALRHA